MITISKLSASLLYLSTFFLAGHSYILDKSCKDGNLSPRMIKYLGESFRHSRIARDLLREIPNAKKRPKQLAQKDLIDHVFSSLVAPDETYRTDSEQWAAVDKVFSNVTVFDKNGDGSPSETPHYTFRDIERPEDEEVVFFCDWTRYDLSQTCEGTEEPPLACDTAYNRTIVWGDRLVNCGRPNSHVLMTHILFDGFYPQVQLCNPFVEYLKSSRVNKGLEEVRNILPKFKYRLHDDSDSVPPVEVAANVVDVLFLGQLTRLIWSPPDAPVAATIDAGEPEASMEWKHILELSAGEGWRNSASFAYFGMGASLISPEKEGEMSLRVNNKGFFHVIPPEDSEAEDSDEF